jgi:hypothetical protein
LDARNSEFADAPDFRVYKFAKGKWPEFALRTVVSAHREEASFRQDFPDARPHPPREIDRGPLSDTPDELEADESARQHDLIEDHRTETPDDPHDGTSEAPSAREDDADQHYRDPEANYESHEDPDPYDYNETEFPQRGDTTSQDTQTPPRKPNGGADRKSDT